MILRIRLEMFGFALSSPPNRTITNFTYNTTKFANLCRKNIKQKRKPKSNRRFPTFAFVYKLRHTSQHYKLCNELSVMSINNNTHLYCNAKKKNPIDRLLIIEPNDKE